ncbi:MAG: hypothetical protein ISR65_08885 [Bacteriovoracaceae bacterium]|nr:hypothetical protein [Bacteriovoracaceae bacterium]
MDITNSIVSALKSSLPWYPFLLNEFVNEVESTFPQLITEYEEEAGERWIRLSLNNELCLLLHVKIPLVFARSDVEMSDKWSCKLDWIKFKDSQSTVFSAKKNVIEELNDGCIGDALDSSNFCLNDLWVVTL